VLGALRAPCLNGVGTAVGNSLLRLATSKGDRAGYTCSHCGLGFIISEAELEVTRVARSPFRPYNAGTGQVHGVIQGFPPRLPCRADATETVVQAAPLHQ
jgi:hypothetical protein